MLTTFVYKICSQLIFIFSQKSINSWNPVWQQLFKVSDLCQKILIKTLFNNSYSLLLLPTFFTNCVTLFSCSQGLFTFFSMFKTFVHNSCSQLWFTTHVHKSCSQILFMTYFKDFCSQLFFKGNVNNFFQYFCSQILRTVFNHNFYSQGLLTNYIYRLCLKLLFTNLAKKFCSQLFFTTFV